MTNAQPEPSMEEILASIRRIISEDEEEQPGVDRDSLEALAEQTARQAEPVTHKEPIVEQNEQVSVNESDSALTQMLDAAEAKRSNEYEEPALQEEPVAFQDHEDVIEETIVEISSEATPAEQDDAASRLETEDVEMVKQQATAEVLDEPMVDNMTASAASAAFGNLTRSVRVSEDEGQTLENIVTQMMRPLVKEWLDENLSRIVEEKVEDEVQRLSRRG